MRPDLSIIVLSFNTKTTTKNCLTSLVSNLSNKPLLKTEIIIVDNASSDESVSMIKNFQLSNNINNIDVVTIFNKKNRGFGGGNNDAIERARGKFILFLNSDTLIKDVDFIKLLERMNKDPRIGVLTIKVVLENGAIDPASHRGFPTIFNSLSYFLKLEKLTSGVPLLNKFFGGYHLSYLDLTKEHEIDSPTGAFYLVKKEVLDKVGGFDEKSFFMYGEDLDLSYRIKKAGYKIIYYPHFTVTHLKYKSGLKIIDPTIQRNTKTYFYDSMKNFYDKHYSKRHSPLVNQFVHLFIIIKKKFHEKNWH